MPDHNTIAVAMSGGVDSSTVAAMLRAEGHNVVGLTMQLWNQRRLAGREGMPEAATGRCCSLDDVYDARRVAETIGIPYYVVNFEEQFHVKRGEHCIRYYMTQGPDVRRRVQESLDFWFPHGAEWFGATDDVKSRMDQLHYRIRGHTNDQLRQQWLAGVVPFCEDVGLTVPAHFDPERQTYVLDYELPILFDETTVLVELEVRLAIRRDRVSPRAVDRFLGRERGMRADQRRKRSEDSSVNQRTDDSDE